MGVEFGLLGDVRAWDGDASVDIGHVRQQCVLAALLVDANRPVTGDQLVDRVWGGRPPVTARGTLATYLTRIRKAVAAYGDVSVDRRSGGYVLTVDPDAVDLHRFTRLLDEAGRATDDRLAVELFERALDLWRGEPLSGLDTPWINDLRESLRRRRFAAELDHADVRLRLGGHAGLLRVLPARVVEHPLDERLAGQLVLALYRAGRLGEALEHYREFRARLVDELGVDPSPALQALHHRILTGEEAVSPPGRGPRQLPARPELFTGRGRHLDLLDRRLDQGFGTAVISTIGGGGGMGKTWLALHWSHERVDRFPDGQLYVDLRGFDPGSSPVPPATALRGFLGALGIAPGAVPAELDERSALYRSLISDKRMLVVLDNAATTEQVTALLPGSSTCTTLVTSRRPLTGLVVRHGALPVPLDVLPEAEARDLLIAHLGVRRVGAEPVAVAELLQHCAGLPLALGIVAARAAVRPDLDLADIAAQLRDHASRLDGLDTGDDDLSLRAVLSWSYHALPEEAVALVGLISLAPGVATSAAAIDSLSPWSHGRTREVLADLEAANLVTLAEGDRYRMHDLVRLYAAERATRDLAEDVRTSALRRVVDFSLHTAHGADRLLDPLRPPIDVIDAADGVVPQPLGDSAEALAWLSAEHATVLAAQRAAVGQGWHSRAWALTSVLDTFHWRQGHADEHIESSRVGLAAVQVLGIPETLVRAHTNLAQAYLRRGRGDEAVEQYDLAIALADRLGDTTSQGHSHLGLAELWGRQGDNARAHHHAAEALELYRASGAPMWEASALNQLGWVSALLHRYDEARVHCEAALALHRSLEHRSGEAETLDSLGYIHEHSGRLGEAVRTYRAAVTAFDELGHTHHAATTLEHLGRTHLALGEPEQAERAWRTAVRHYRTQQRTTEADRLEQRLAALCGPRSSDTQPVAVPG